MKRKPNATPWREVTESGNRKSQQVYPCGCVASYCLCGCENPPEIRDCPTHAAALPLLAACKKVPRCGCRDTSVPRDRDTWHGDGCWYPAFAAAVKKAERRA